MSRHIDGQCIGGPLTDDQQDVVDELRSYGDEDSAREYEDFSSGWNDAEDD
jgi:hypothetical protein